MHNVENVVSNKNCVYCGLCRSVCPTETIRITYDESVGFFKPYVDNKKCINCGKCIKYCPSKSERNSKNLIGDTFLNILAYSSNIKVREGATSGGVINELVRYLLSDGLVDCVIMTACTRYGLGTKQVFMKKENVDLLEKNPRDYSSRYVVIPILQDFVQHLHLGEKIALVGTPCQIIAARNYIDLNTSKIAKKPLLIGIACSGGMSFKATEQFKKIKKMENSTIYYRGCGWPGKNTLIYNDYSISEDHLGSLFERIFSSQIFRNPACRMCADQFAEQADISFCDYWNSKELSSEGIGKTCVIIRNREVRKIVDIMISEGKIAVSKELTDEEVAETQLQVLKLKKGNIRCFKTYRLLNFFTDIIFQYRLYRFFNYKAYKIWAYLYNRIYQKGKIEEE